MVRLKKIGLIFGLMLGPAVIAQTAKAEDPISALGAGVNRVGAEAGMAVTGVLNKVTGSNAAVPVSPSPAPTTAISAGEYHHHRHHHHHRHS
ncbi:hypothetical protein [Methylocystis sp. B8]|uniref:hypothetical protein n=1 Tax=Methylocystis sp. B8 TaxID=544938 RepID=UPI0010FCEA75|nr:hypothetical protein [Methylocystis sp. B8]TLG75064.1 hypothetical protein FEV16_11085 [Methylocystis sp. B8]